MEKELVGTVTVAEKDEIQSYFVKKMGLLELVQTLKNDYEDEELYQKVVHDLGEVKLKMENWWRSKSEKYQWKGIKGCSWNIDFETCEIFLVQLGN